MYFLVLLVIAFPDNYLHHCHLRRNASNVLLLGNVKVERSFDFTADCTLIIAQ